MRFCAAFLTSSRRRDGSCNQVDHRSVCRKSQLVEADEPRLTGKHKNSMNRTQENHLGGVSEVRSGAHYRFSHFPLLLSLSPPLFPCLRKKKLWMKTFSTARRSCSCAILHRCIDSPIRGLHIGVLGLSYVCVVDMWICMSCERGREERGEGREGRKKKSRLCTCLLRSIQFKSKRD